MKPYLLIFLLSVAAAGCSGINYSQVAPESKSFHPRSVAVLPASIGEYESAREIVESAVSVKLVKTKWFSNVADASTIRARITQSPDISESAGKYIQQLNTLGVSDPVLAGRLREELNADALFLTYVTSWGYGRQDGNKVARVGLGVKVIDTRNGSVVWRANHELIEEYTIFKPALPKMTDELLSLLLKEMPH